MRKLNMTCAAVLLAATATAAQAQPATGGLLGNALGNGGGLGGLLGTLDGGASGLGTLPGLEGLLDGVADIPVPADALGDLIRLSPVSLGDLTGALGSLDGSLVILRGNSDGFATLPGLNGLGD